jgi:hypothetical protein
MAKKTQTVRRRRKLDWTNLDEEIKKNDKANFRDDGYSDNLFTPTLKQDGTFQAIIRFLPRPEDDGIVPYVKLMNHGFQDVGGWFIENCPTTLGRECPVCKDNSKLWNEGDEITVKKRGRRTHYFSNVLIVNDPQQPANNGTVKIFRYGKTIHDMIMEKIKPDSEGIDEKVNVFDYDTGMNFKLKIKPKKTKDGSYNDYSSSEFTGQVVSVGSDEEINAIDEQLFNLGIIVEENKFKDYKELEKLFKQKIGEATIPVSSSQDEKEEEKDDGVLPEESKPSQEKNFEEEVSGNDEEPEEFFNKINKE